MIKLYLCGPMTGLPDYNYPAFRDGANQLRTAGFEVFNPAENGLPADAPWAEHMRVDIINLMTCQGVAVLPGTDTSRGAKLELHNALELGMPVASVGTWVGFLAPISEALKATENMLEGLIEHTNSMLGAATQATQEPPHV